MITVQKQPMFRVLTRTITHSWHGKQVGDKLPDDVVSVAPEGHFVKWDGKKWVHDADAEKIAQITQATQQKESLLALAASKIAPLQDAVDLDIATEAEAALLLAWKKYRVLLNRINPNDTPDINWPEQPAERSISG